MQKMKPLFAAAVVLAMVFGVAQPANANAKPWSCTQLTGGGGGTWLCSDDTGYWYVDCSSGPCRYEPF